MITTNIIKYIFYILFFFTPLFFLPFTNELFEYNKMMLVYILTILIVGLWLFRMLSSKTLILKSTPLDIPLMLFLLSQIASTIFSIDPHTSWWGYYSRSNGGLYSIFSYILLFYALVSNFTKDDVSKFLKASLLGGLLVSLYAIPEHFGLSPSCLILTGQATADCWVQDVQARVFATLGQPNWLAAYLGMLIFPSIYFVLISKKLKSQIFYGTIAVLYYLAFTFTYSRGATLGLLAGLGVFIVGYFVSFQQKLESRITGSQIKSGMTVLIIFILVNLLFGSSLTGDFRLINQSAPAARPGLVTQAPSGTQLETGGTESGQIRLIVWQGALDIFKHYPLFGSGVETFAYSYYNFRPLAHNLVSEWDFLYNKAHNEYLNYLATTGLFGFLTYMAVIISFFVFCIRYLLSSLKNKKDNAHLLLLNTSLLASYTAYLVQNFFGFSVVIIAVLFYLFPALAFLATDSNSEINLKNHLVFSKLLFIKKIIFKNSFFTYFFKTLVVLLMIYFVSFILKNWVADRLYKLGTDYAGVSPSKSYQNLRLATTLNEDEPLYHVELGAASSEVALGVEDATLSASFKLNTIAETEKALEISPRNLSILRTAIRNYYLLASSDPQFEEKTLEVVEQSIKLAPTDPKLFYNKGLILSQFQKNDEAVQAFEKAIELKPNYREAHLTLAQTLNTLGKKDQALKEVNLVLEMIPNDPDALSIKQEIEAK